MCTDTKKIDEIIAADKNGKFLIQQDRTANQSYPYCSEVQFQMYLHGAASCDLVVHTIRDFHVYPVDFDCDYAVMLVRKPETFFKCMFFLSLQIKTLKQDYLQNTQHYGVLAKPLNQDE